VVNQLRDHSRRFAGNPSPVKSNSGLVAALPIRTDPRDQRTKQFLCFLCGLL